MAWIAQQGTRKFNNPLSGSQSLPYLKAMDGSLFVAGNAKLVGRDTSPSLGNPLCLPRDLSGGLSQPPVHRQRDTYTTFSFCFFVHAFPSLWNGCPPALRSSAPLCLAVPYPPSKAQLKCQLSFVNFQDFCFGLEL